MTSRFAYDNPFMICQTATATAAKHAMRLALACCRESPGGSVCREFFRAIDGRKEPAPSPAEGDLAPLFPDAAKGEEE